MNDPNRPVEKLLRKWLYAISDDLEQSLHQTVQTTKLLRRQRSLAYILEALTGGDRFNPDEVDCLELLSVIDALASHASSAEATAALERASKRLRWLLDHPLELRGTALCEGCREVIRDGAPHECTNRYSQSKDSAMTRDDTVQ